jgi:hypothetical protein
MRLSEHAQALIAMRDTLRAAMLRPDLHTLRHRTVVDALLGMERDGLLVPDGAGALVPAPLFAPERDGYPHVGRVCFNLGFMWHDIAERLRSAGWTRAGMLE